MKRKKLDSLGVSAFCESMAMMVQAGIQTDEAVELLQRQEESGGVLETGLRAMHEQLEQGMSLSQAMRESGIFPTYALQMIETGERSGRLESVLFRLSAYYADRQVISDKVRGAVVYPAVMLVLIIAVVTVLLAAVLPAFTDVYDSLTGGLASSGFSYVSWSYVLCWAALVLMVLLAVVLFGGLMMWSGGHRAAVEKILYHVPLCGQILQELGMFRFTAAMSTFLASGEMQDEAVLSSIPMADCAPLETRLKSCARRMEEGHGFPQAAYDEELFEPVYGRMLLAGERSGSMQDVLERLNSLLGERVSTLVDRLVGIVDPLLSGVLILVIGFALLSVMLPLIGMMNGIG